MKRLLLFPLLIASAYATPISPSAQVQPVVVVDETRTIISDLGGTTSAVSKTGPVKYIQFVDSNGKIISSVGTAISGSAVWGMITGTLSSQSDLNTALSGKVPTTRTVNSHALSSNVTVTASDVGLGSVDNTADTAKPVSTAQQTALNLKADLAGPTFTGTVTLPSGQALVAPVLGTPVSLVGTNITGTAAGLTAGTASAVAVGGITGLGTGVATALAANTGSAGAPVLFNGAGGTPSSLTGTNITGIPESGVTSLVSDLALKSPLASPAFTTAITLDGVTVPTISSTATFTNKKITKRVGSTASSATPSIDSDSYDEYDITALAAAITSLTITGSPTNGQSLILRIKDDGTAHALAFGTTSCAFSSDLAAPTTTTLGKYLYCTFLYNSTLTKWVLTGKLDNV